MKIENDLRADPLRDMKKPTSLEEALEVIDRLKAETNELQNKLAKSKVDKSQMKKASAAIKKALKSTSFASEDDGKNKVGCEEF